MPAYGTSAAFAAFALLVGIATLWLIPADSNLGVLPGLWGFSPWVVASGLLYKVLDKADKSEEIDGLSAYKTLVLKLRVDVLRKRVLEVFLVAFALLAIVFVMVAGELAGWLRDGTSFAAGVAAGSTGVIAIALAIRWYGQAARVVSDLKHRENALRRGEKLAEKLRTKANGA